MRPNSKAALVGRPWSRLALVVERTDVAFSLSRGNKWCELVAFVKARDRLAAGEARVQLVPVGDLALAHLPAEVHVAALVAADEIDQARLVVLELHADARQLIDERLKAIDGGLELRLW